MKDRIKQERKKANLKRISETDHLKENIVVFEELFSTNNTDDVTVLLEEIELLVHHFESAMDFVKIGGLERVVYKCLNSTSFNIKYKALQVLGAATQNHADIQSHILNSGGLDILTRMLALDDNYLVKSRVLHVLGGVLRGYPMAQLKFMDMAGLNVLSRLMESNDIRLQLKIVTLIDDLLKEESQTSFENVHDMIEEKILELGFCHLVEELFLSVYMSDDIDSIEKCLSAMGTRICRGKYKEKTLQAASSLIGRFQRLDVEDKESGQEYYKSLINLVEGILKNVQRTEL